jgi:hypothetical protein
MNFALRVAEATEFERLCGDRSRGEFVRILLALYRAQMRELDTNSH